MSNPESEQSLTILKEFRPSKEKVELLILYYLRDNMVESVEAFRTLGLLQPDPGPIRTLQVGNIDFDKVTEEAIKEFPPRVLDVIDRYNSTTREITKLHPGSWHIFFPHCLW